MYQRLMFKHCQFHILTKLLLTEKLERAILKLVNMYEKAVGCQSNSGIRTGIFLLVTGIS
jgi:hypothetical protein